MSGFFLSGDNFFGRLHPASRLIVLFLSFAPPMLVADPIPMAMILAAYLAIMAASGAWRNLRKVGFLIAVFVIITTPMWAVFYKTDDAPFFHSGPISLSPASVAYGVAMTLRLIAFLTTAVIFLSATRVEELTYGLKKLGLPYRASFSISLAFRLTPLFMESAEQIMQAQKVRGLDVDSGGIVRKSRRYIAILAPVLFSALRRANGLAVALEAKGFSRAGRRTSMTDYRVSWRDPVWIVVMLFVIVGVVIYRLRILR